MQQSESIKTLAPAFIKAQKAVEGAEKNKANPGFKGTRYADLSSVVEACKEALNSNGIGYVQTPVPAEPGFLQLSTVLIHESGEWISGTIQLPLAKQDPQGYGSAMTYARRYGLAAMVGVCPEDDDGNGAMPPGVPTDPAGRPAQGNQPMTGAKKASDLL
jgi:hypothetical protein